MIKDNAFNHVIKFGWEQHRELSKRTSAYLNTVYTVAREKVIV